MAMSRKQVLQCNFPFRSKLFEITSAGVADGKAPISLESFSNFRCRIGPVSVDPVLEKTFLEHVYCLQIVSSPSAERGSYSFVISAPSPMQSELPPRHQQ